MENRIFIALLIGHWLGDYTHLSTPWMLQAKRLGTPIKPIFAHAIVHCILTIIALVIYGVSFKAILFGAAIQLSTHFAIDVWKGRMNGWFPSLQSPANPFHWYVFGLDQMLHIIVLVIITNIAA